MMAAASGRLGSNNLTSFVLNGRQETLLVGDYSLYAKRLSKRILVLRKKLGLATPKNAKFKKQEPITVEQLKQNDAYIHLILLNAERCWAKAMYTKSIQPENSVVTGANRIYIITKLNKAAKYAWTLYTLLRDYNAVDTDLLQIRAYHASLIGAEEFEKQSEGQKPKGILAKKDRWNRCLRSYSTTRVIYSTLSSHLPHERFQDFIANTVDPMLRYVAHQARLSRSIALPSVAFSHFPKDDSVLATALTKLDANALSEQVPLETTAQQDRSSTEVAANAPSRITWRGHQADISDAAIGQALAQVASAEVKLKHYLDAHPDAADSDKAAAYDDALLASQDAVDATKRAADELEKEGVDESDARMQDIRVTTLYTQYELISWRVGRNRVLIGRSDGLDPQPGEAHTSKRKRGSAQANDLSSTKRLAKLRQRLVLYDATLQSIESIKSIRGARRDSAFVAELDGSLAYFKALKAVSVAASHAIHANHVNALALLIHTRDLAQQAAESAPVAPSDNAVPKLAIDKAAIAALQAYIGRSTSRHHALAEMTKLHESGKASTLPLIQRLNQFPALGTSIDVKNVVSFPPRFETVPVKPIFLDVAWNYIDYPGRVKAESGPPPLAARNDTVRDIPDPEQPEPKKEKKSGWFGFGRS